MRSLLLAVAVLAGAGARADEVPAAPQPAGADSRWPVIVGAQLTAIEQNQSTLHSPYRGALSLDPAGDTQPTETVGLYLAWAPLSFVQLYADTEKFNGAGVSNATGLGGLTNGDVVREGSESLPKTFYLARAYARVLIPLGEEGDAPDTTRAEASQDQIGGWEPAHRLELKVGKLAVSDDFDRNRYAGSARTEFLNWSLWQNTAWDYAADTRGYTNGFVVGFVSPRWQLRYGAYLMPEHANGQQLESSFRRARGEQVELTLTPKEAGPIVRVLAYRNIARMGSYEEAVAIAALNHTVPDVAANDEDGRRKYGFGVNVEQALADDGETGVFVRAGWNDGKNESFAFTEVDRHLSAGVQIDGVHWARAADRLGVALVSEGLARAHADYLAAGGSGFLLADGALHYGHEQILETYYRIEWSWPFGSVPQRPPHAAPRIQLSPDFQFVRRPGYNEDRGPVHFFALRLHLEY